MLTQSDSFKQSKKQTYDTQIHKTITEAFLTGLQTHFKKMLKKKGAHRSAGAIRTAQDKTRKCTYYTSNNSKGSTAGSTQHEMQITTGRQDAHQITLNTL